MTKQNEKPTMTTRIFEKLGFSLFFVYVYVIFLAKFVFFFAFYAVCYILHTIYINEFFLVVI